MSKQSGGGSGRSAVGISMSRLSTPFTPYAHTTQIGPLLRATNTCPYLFSAFSVRFSSDCIFAVQQGH